MTLRTALFLAITVLANSGGEIAVTRATNDLGEVKQAARTADFAVRVFSAAIVSALPYSIPAR